MPRLKTFSSIVSTAILLAGCAGGIPAPVGAPVADPAALAARVQQATTPAGGHQVNFTWTLDEAGSRVSGRGVVRSLAPERLRLDLFGPRGETYLAAALVGDEFRLPPAAAQAVELPSPALLWAALGVVRPPSSAPLLSATADSQQVALRYGTGGRDVFDYRLAARGDTFRVTRLERIGPQGVIESVQVEHTPAGEPSQARYRNWSAYRDLTLQVESSTDVPSFPESIWSPGGEPR